MIKTVCKIAQAACGATPASGGERSHRKSESCKVARSALGVLRDLLFGVELSILSAILAHLCIVLVDKTDYAAAGMDARDGAGRLANTNGTALSIDGDAVAQSGGNKFGEGRR